MDFFTELPSVLQALIATVFTYAVTALGAAVVFFFRSVNQKVLDSMMGFSAGVMIAASFWSLLNPSIELSKEMGNNPWLVPAVSFIIGGLFIVLSDRLLNNYSFLRFVKDSSDQHSCKRSALLVSAVTLHNIPEGLAVGVAFGGVAAAIPGSTIIGAIVLALGIGIQNFPEGTAVSLVLRREGFSTKRSFFYGQVSGLVEPIAGVVGAIAAITMQSILPAMLAFSAGAMILVVSSELIPESAKKNKNLASLGVVLGFVVMMILDVALG